MSWLRSRFRAQAAFGLGQWFALLAVAVSLCACSTSSPTSYEAGVQESDTPRRLVGMPPRPYVEVEDDGLEAQLPPLQSKVSIPDDPTEPFSPNYGSMPAEWRAVVEPEQT